MDEKLLQENSGFFAAALKKDWREGQQRVVELPEADSGAFNTWLNWLYCRRLYLAAGPDEERVRNRCMNDAISAYALGSVLLDSDFMDAVIDAIAVETCIVEGGLSIVPHPEAVTLAYDKTPQNSMLRKLLVCRHANAKNASELISEECDPRFILDLAKLLADSARSKPSRKTFISLAARCNFHEHGPGAENCYRTKYHAPFSFSK